MTPTYPTICHRDGTVTLWDVYQQSWTRTSDPTDEQLSAMGRGERERVRRHLDKIRTPRRNA